MSQLYAKPRYVTAWYRAKPTPRHPDTTDNKQCDEAAMTKYA